MIILTIDNSFSRLDGLTTEQLKALRQQLSYTPNKSQAYFSGNVYRQYLIDKKGNFPTGLLTRQLKLLRPDNITDNRVKPKANTGLFKLSLPFTPYEDQLKIKELNQVRGTIVSPTGTGKSISIALLIDRLQLRTLIIVPSLEIKSQLYSNFCEYFGKQTMDKKDICVENIDALDTSKELKGYDCLIIDEAHHSASKTYQKLNKLAWKNIYYRYFFTATPFRGRDEEQILLESIIGDVIYKLDYKTAIDKGYICPVEAYYFELDKTKTSGTKWGSVYNELIVNNANLHNLVINLSVNLIKNNKITLILVKQIEHGEILSNIFDKLGYYIPFANGKDELSTKYIKDLASGRLPCLIATSIVGEGVDTKAAEYVLLAGGTGKSRVQIMQNIGRVLRKYKNKESGKVIAFKEPSHKWFKKHHQFFTGLLEEEYGIIISKLEA